MVLQCINIRQVPRKVLKTAAFGLGFQHLPRDLVNVNAWKTMFDPYNNKLRRNSCFKLHTNREEPQQRNRIGTASRINTGGLNQFYSSETSSLILMRCQLPMTNWRPAKRTKMGPTIGIDSQVPTFWNILGCSRFTPATSGPMVIKHFS